MLSKDASILRPESEARERMLALSTIVERLHVVVLTTRERKNDAVQGVYQEAVPRIRVDRRLVIHPTNSTTKLSSLVDAWRIGRELLPPRESRGNKGWLVTVQDPFETGFVGWLLSMRRSVALELQIHTDIGSPFFKKESLKNILRTSIARFLLVRAKGVRVVSARVAGSTSKVLGRIPETLPVFGRATVTSVEVPNEKRKASAGVTFKLNRVTLV